MQAENPLLPHAKELGDLQITMHTISQQKAMVRSMLDWAFHVTAGKEVTPKVWMLFLDGSWSGEKNIEPILSLHESVRELGLTLLKLKRVLSDFEAMPKILNHLQKANKLFLSLPFIQPELDLLKKGANLLDHKEFLPTFFAYLKALEQIGEELHELKKVLLEEMLDTISISYQEVSKKKKGPIKETDS